MIRFYALFVLASYIFAQDQPATPTPVETPKPVLNIFIDRVGFGKDVNYGYAEWFQIRGTKKPKWSVILPDVGIIFFDNIGRYREAFVGARFKVQPIKSLTIDHEAYYVQATGVDAHRHAYYQPWTRVEYHFHKHFMLESVAFPYIPLNGGTTQFVMERTKLEYSGFKHFNIGGGEGAYQDFTYTKFQSKPFASVTVRASPWVTLNSGSKPCLDTRSRFSTATQ